MLRIISAKYVWLLLCLFLSAVRLMAGHTTGDNGLAVKQQIAVGSMLLNAKEIDSLNRVIMRSPKLKEPYVLRAYYYISNGNYSDATTDINRVLAADENYVPALHLQAVIYYEQKDFERAKAGFERVIQLNPQHAYGHQGLALCSNTLAESLREVEIAYSLDSNDFWILSTYAMIATRLQMFALADKLATRVINEAEVPAEYYAFLVAVNMGLGDSVRVRTLLQQGFQKFGHHTALLYQASLFYIAIEEYDKATDALNELLLVDASNTYSYALLAQVHLQQQDTATALKHIQKYIAITAPQQMNYKAAANITSRIGRPDITRQLLDSAIIYETDTVSLLDIKARVALAKGDLDATENYLAELIAIAPYELEYRFWHLEVLGAMNEFNAMLQACNNIRDIDSTLESLHWYYMRAYWGKYNYWMALKYARLHTAAFPERANGYICMAKLQSELKEKNDAMLSIDTALMIEGYGGDATVQLLWLMITFEDYTRLQEVITAINDKPTVLPACYFMIARTFVLGKDFKGAIPFYTKAIALEPNNGEIYYYRAAARLFSGDESGGCADLRKAVTLGYTDAKGSLKLNCN